MGKISGYPQVGSMGTNDVFLIDTYPFGENSTSIVSKADVLGVGSVLSVFGRTGTVTATSGDYTAAQVGALASTTDLSAISSANATVGAVSMNSHKITNLTNGSSAQDAAAFGQIPTSASTIGGLTAANNLSDVANAATALTNLGAASSGANSSITSLSGLTTALSIAQGGTGQTTKAPAFNALSPMTTAGDIIYGGSSGAGTRLAAGTSSQLLIGGTTPSWGAVNLASMVTGNLPVTNLNSGTSAASTTYWRGDGTWATPAGSGTVTGPSTATVANDIVVWKNTDKVSIIDSGYVLPASAIVGLTDTQTLTNKTLTTPTTTFATGGATFNGSSSGSTVLNASAVASGTLTLPAATDTLASIAATQTFTNKTIVATSNTVSFATFTNPYKFSAYQAGSWSTPSNAFGAITFDTKLFDTGTNYSTSTSRFTAPVSGFYQFNAGFNFSGTSGGTTLYLITLYVNGSETARGTETTAPATNTNNDGTVSAFLQLSATNYVQVYVFTIQSLMGNTGINLTYFNGYLVSPS